MTRNFSSDELTVRRTDNSIICVLNGRLAGRKELDEARLLRLKQLHVELDALKTEMTAENEPLRLRELATRAEAIEFAQQAAWGFDEDRNFHNWYGLPKCRCPKMDNADYSGSELRITMDDCPLHGSLPLVQSEYLLTLVAGLPADDGFVALLLALNCAPNDLTAASLLAGLEKCDPMTRERLRRIRPRSAARRSDYDLALKGLLMSRLYEEPLEAALAGICGARTAPCERAATAAAILATAIDSGRP